jgi:hypothetical protein
MRREYPLRESSKFESMFASAVTLLPTKSQELSIFLAVFWEFPLCAKSGPSLTIIIYVRNIFGLASKEASHPSMMETSRATTSAVPPTADIVGHRGHVRKVPQRDIAPPQLLHHKLFFAFVTNRCSRESWQFAATPECYA